MVVAFVSNLSPLFSLRSYDAREKSTEIYRVTGGHAHGTSYTFRGRLIADRPKKVSM